VAALALRGDGGCSYLGDHSAIGVHKTDIGIAPDFHRFRILELRPPYQLEVEPAVDTVLAAAVDLQDRRARQIVGVDTRQRGDDSGGDVLPVIELAVPTDIPLLLWRSVVTGLHGAVLHGLVVPRLQLGNLERP
jgi:hypothetical protein